MNVVVTCAGYVALDLQQFWRCFRVIVSILSASVVLSHKSEKSLYNVSRTQGYRVYLKPDLTEDIGNLQLSLSGNISNGAATHY
jgi:hypothetical protein